jgi:hypothetical protein
MGQGRKQKNATKKQYRRRKDAAAKRRRRRKVQLRRCQVTYADSGAPVELMGNKTDWLKLGNNVRQMVKNEGITRLTQVREMIATESGLPMPPVRMVPFGWMNPQETGVVFGKAHIVSVKRKFQWGVIVPASTIVIVDEDDILRRIVCHEFAHCLWHIAKIIREMKDGEWRSIESSDKLSDKEVYDEQLKRDKDQLVNPVHWFGEWDVKHFLPEGRGVLDEATDLFADRWYKLGLPIETPSLRYDFEGKMWFPDEIVEHIRKLDTELNPTDQ